MKAMLLSQYKHLEVVDMPKPDVGDNDLLVEVRACGICGSDIHGWDGSTGRRIPPLVMGHEAAGVVSAVGPSVTGFKVGDRVTFDSTVSCGHCPACRAGRINLCQNRQVLGVSCNEFRRNGAFAEYVVVPQHISYHLPEGLSFEHAALIEAVSIAVHAANRTPMSLGATAVVVGSGMIGLLVIQAVRLAGAARVIAVDIDDAKLKIAQSLGADYVLNGKKVNVPQEVAALTAGQGADVGLEVVGATATIQSTIDSVKRGGSVTLVGNLSPKVELPLQSVVTRELSIYGSCASNGEYPECIEYLRRGDIKVEPLITATAKLEDGPEWFEKLYAGLPGAMKVILQPNG
jgi:L-iditol 2-dehydrogenase